MYKLKNYADASAGIKEFVADTKADLNDITDCEMGSTCLVLSELKLYIKNSKGEWVPCT